MISKTFKNSYEDVFIASKKALAKLNITVDRADKNNKTIIGTTKTSFLSWGEKIQINFKSSQSSTKIEVESTSTAQLISWGKNGENEKTIIEQITKYLQNK